jgi:hypothetical protein
MYEMPLTVLLSKPQTVPTPALFFQAWPSLAQGATPPILREAGLLSKVIPCRACEGGNELLGLAQVVGLHGAVAVHLLQFGVCMWSLRLSQVVVAGVELTGVCRNRGAVGGLQALTALEAVFSRVSLQPLPAQGGFHAAYAGMHRSSLHRACVDTRRCVHAYT